MSGHSKWAKIKRQKAATDAKKGNIFTKLGNNITVAARQGGDPEMNFSLRLAIDKARTANMPKENIERAIKRGTGELGGSIVEQLTYEGFGPAKSSFILEVFTDNKNRAAAEIRHLFTKKGGGLGNVSWNFDHLGVIRVAKENITQNRDGLELELIDAGADDIKEEDGGVIILASIANLQKLKNFLDNKNIKTESAGIEYLPKNKKELNSEEKQKVEQFVEELEENDDVNNYYTDVTL